MEARQAVGTGLEGLVSGPNKQCKDCDSEGKAERLHIWAGEKDLLDKS